jgi:hypothetical protein
MKPVTPKLDASAEVKSPMIMAYAKHARKVVLAMEALITQMLFGPMVWDHTSSKLEAS